MLGRLHQLCADIAECAHGVRAPVASRALDSDSKALLEFRRRLGDPVSLPNTSPVSLIPHLQPKHVSECLLGLQVFLAQPPHAWVGTACITSNGTLWMGVTCTNGRVTALQLTQYKNLLSGEPH